MTQSPEIKPFHFDGKGINAPDKFRSRIATFSNGNMATIYGLSFERVLNSFECPACGYTFMECTCQEKEG